MSKTKWVLDPTHSELGFKIKHLMTNVSGAIKTFNTEVETDGNDFTTAIIELTADMNSISTNNEHRDIHLKNADFFETEVYPDLTFTSTSIQKLNEESFSVQGELTLKGITRPVSLTV